jgi:uncharacterized protein YkwD
MKKLKEIILYIIAVCLFVIIIVVVDATKPKKADVVPESVENKIECTHDLASLFNKINSYRSENGLNKLVIGNSLVSFAQERSNSLNGVLDEHNGFRVMSKSGKYDSFSYLGENLMGESSSWCKNELYNDSIDTFNSWMSSPTHNKNLLDTRWDSIGLAFYNGVFVAEFGQTR